MSTVFDPIDRAIAAVLARERGSRAADAYIREVAGRLIEARRRAIAAELERLQAETWPSGPLTRTGGSSYRHA